MGVRRARRSIGNHGVCFAWSPARLRPPIGLPPPPDAVAIRVVQLGSPRSPGEGTRLGTVRRPPRGVRKEEIASRDYFDVWLPELAPSQEVVSWALSEPWTGIYYDVKAQVLNTDGDPIPGLCAAGETVGIYYGRYPGATSVLRGAVFGRRAGLTAAEASTARGAPLRA